MSVFCFLVTTHAYAVLRATDAREAVCHLSTDNVDAIVIDVPGAAKPIELTLKLKEIKRWVPIALLGDANCLNGYDHGADMLLHKNKIASAELLERLHAISARKRGPRKTAGEPIPQLATA